MVEEERHIGAASEQLDQRSHSVNGECPNCITTSIRIASLLDTETQAAVGDTWAETFIHCHRPA